MLALFIQRRCCTSQAPSSSGTTVTAVHTVLGRYTYITKMSHGRPLGNAELTRSAGAAVKLRNMTAVTKPGLLAVSVELSQRHAVCSKGTLDGPRGNTFTKANLMAPETTLSQPLGMNTQATSQRCYHAPSGWIHKPAFASGSYSTSQPCSRNRQVMNLSSPSSSSLAAWMSPSEGSRLYSAIKASTAV